MLTSTTAIGPAPGVNLGPFFRTLKRVWSGPGEALGEVSLPEAFERHGLDVHPLVLDGCFQVFGTARKFTESEGAAAYLPFGWEQLWACGAAAGPRVLPCAPERGVARRGCGP